MNIHELAQSEKIEEKISYKELYREVFFNVIDNFFPKYITHGKNLNFFESVKEVIISDFDENIGKTNSLLYTENLSKKLNSMDITKLNSCEQKYWDFLKSKIISSSKEVFLTKTNSKMSLYIDYLKNKNKLFKYNNLNSQTISFKSIASDVKSIFSPKVSISEKSVKKLQQLREKYQIEIIVANNISWKDVYNWAEKIEKILEKTTKLLDISHKNECFKYINLICCEEIIESTGLFAPTIETNYIKLCLKDEQTMYKVWLHELTHFLDFKTCQFLTNHKNIVRAYYYSDYLIFNQLKNYYSNDEKFIAENKVVSSNINFLKMALGVNEEKGSMESLKFENDIKLLKIENYFYVSLLEKLEIPYKENELIFLRTDNFEFLTNLVTTISQLSLSKTENFINEFYKKNNNSIEKIIKNITLTYKLNEEKQIVLKETLLNPDFLSHYIETTKKYLYNEGMLINKFLIGDARVVNATHSHVKKALISSEPSYWASIVEIVARTTEGLAYENIKKPFMERFKLLGNKTLLKEIEKNTINNEYSPDENFYTEEKRSIIKIYLKDMFDFVNDKLTLDLDKNNSLNKNIAKSL